MDAPPRNRNEWPDAALLWAIAERDGAAFAVFYGRHVPMVLACGVARMREQLKETG
jgi:hypothetical protein